MNKEYLNEIAEFKRAIIEHLTKIKEDAEKSQNQNITSSDVQQIDSSIVESGGDAKHDIVPSTTCPTDSKETNYPPNSAGARSKDDIDNSVQASTSKAGQMVNSKKIHFEESLSEKPSYVDLGNVITEIVVIGPRGSQVVKVDSMEFSKLIFEQNMMCDRNSLPKTAIPKVFDPVIGRRFDVDSWGDRVPISYDYEDCMDYTVSEVTAYCALAEFSGDFIPRMYAYGRLSDYCPCADALYLKLCGGYLMIEMLEEDPDFEITEEFFDEEILPAYMKMHSRNVLQNDIKKDNAIITTDGHFKIIDFGHSIISTSEAEKKAEIDLVYEHFGL